MATDTDRHAPIPDVYADVQRDVCAEALGVWDAALCAQYAGCSAVDWSRYAHAQRGMPLPRLLALVARLALRHPLVAVAMIAPIARIAGADVRPRGGFQVADSVARLQARLHVEMAEYAATAADAQDPDGDGGADQTIAERRAQARELDDVIRAATVLREKLLGEIEAARPGARQLELAPAVGGGR